MIYPWFGLEFKAPCISQGLKCRTAANSLLARQLKCMLSCGKLQLSSFQISLLFLAETGSRKEFVQLKLQITIFWNTNINNEHNVHTHRSVKYRESYFIKLPWNDSGNGFSRFSFCLMNSSLRTWSAFKKSKVEELKPYTTGHNDPQGYKPCEGAEWMDGWMLCYGRSEGTLIS